jgi:hypothetical protein
MREFDILFPSTFLELKMNKNTLIKQLIKEDKMHQAHPIKELFEKAASINKTFTITTEPTEDDCNWTNGAIKFKNSQVVPFYVPKSRLISVCGETTEPLEFTYNLQSVLAKM